MRAIDLTGRTAVITGATRNVGRAIARALAESGCAVGVLGGSNQDHLDQTLAELRLSHVECAGELVNLADADAIEAALNRLRDVIGEPDILVNNAAVRPRQSIQEAGAAEWDAVMAINLRAPYLLARALLPAMQRRGYGRIVNVSGLDAFWGAVDKVHVVASKAGLIGLTHGLAVECANSGVTVNTIVPGVIDTDRQGVSEDVLRHLDEIVRRVPMQRMGRMDEVANACLFLASDLASYITGATITVSGGAYPTLRPSSAIGADRDR